jgi:hypothetical protein
MARVSGIDRGGGSFDKLRVTYGLMKKYFEIFKVLTYNSQHEI